MIDGIWWLVILFAIIIALWLIAKARGEKTNGQRTNTKSKSVKPNDALQKTAALLQQFFPDYRVARKANHLLVSKHNKKVAMITIDKKVAASQRRLGSVPVINYHRIPSRAQLTVNLQDIE